VLTYTDFTKICTQSGLAIREETNGIGRELYYTHGPKRIIVVHYRKAEFIESATITLNHILRLMPNWLLINRYGDFNLQAFTNHKTNELIEELCCRYPTVCQQGDDLYILETEGTTLISFDHGMHSDGLTLFVNQTRVAGDILLELNRIGDEVELFCNLS
jgi:hypothetical protein